MRKDNVVIVVPAIIVSGPIKGAIAMANAISKDRKTYLVSLKGREDHSIYLSGNVNFIDLSQCSSWFGKVKHLKKLLLELGGRGSVVTLSMGFSADMLTILCKRNSVIGVSVRGNLVQNYRMTYGIGGVFLAHFHLLAMRSFDFVTSMNSVMARQVDKYIPKASDIIHNFIDEAPLSEVKESGECSRSNTINLIFVGSLTVRKQAHLLVEALYALSENQPNLTLTILGEGDEQNRIQKLSIDLGLQNKVYFKGFTKDPYKELLLADVFILPSLSEGTPRAALEALYMGLPCVLRRCDGNEELIAEGVNGYLFSDNNELPSVIKNAIKLRRRNERINLLPEQCRQSIAVKNYLEVFDKYYA